MRKLNALSILALVLVFAAATASAQTPVPRFA